MQQVNLLVEDKGRVAAFPEIFIVLTYGVLVLPCTFDHIPISPNKPFVS